MKDTKKLLTHFTTTDNEADRLLKEGYDIFCISYGYDNEFDLIVYFDKIIKCYSLVRFGKSRSIERTFQKINELENWLRRYVGNVKDYLEIIKDKKFTSYSIEVETKKGVEYLMLNVVYGD